MTFRVMYSVVLLFSVLFLPYWFSLLLALVGVFYFDLYFEALALLFIADTLYGAKELRYFGFTFVTFLLGGVFLALSEFMKNKLKFYHKH